MQKVLSTNTFYQTGVNTCTRYSMAISVIQQITELWSRWKLSVHPTEYIRRRELTQGITEKNRSNTDVKQDYVTSPTIFNICLACFHDVLFTQGQFWPSGMVVACVCMPVCLCVRVPVCVYQSRACSHNSSPLVQARITKFETKMQKT